MFLISLCSALVLIILALAMLNQREAKNAAIGFEAQNRFEIRQIYLILFCAVLVLTSSVRYGFIDTYAYKIMYTEMHGSLEYIEENPWEIEKGWLYFLYFLNLISSSPNFMLFVSALIINIAYVRTMHKYSADVAFSLIVYFCINYLDTNNGLRQFVSAAIILFAFPLLAKKKYILYALCVLLAAQLHESAYICLIFLLILPGKALNLRVCLALLVGIVFLINPALINDFLEGAFADSDSKYSMYLDKDNGMGVMRAFIIGILPLLLTFIHLRKCSKERIPISQQDALMINTLIINSAFVLMGLYMQYWARLCFYTSFAPMVLMPKLLHSFTGDRYYRLYKTIALILYIAYFCYNVYVNINYGAMKDFYVDITFA